MSQRKSSSSPFTLKVVAINLAAGGSAGVGMFDYLNCIGRSKADWILQ